MKDEYTKEIVPRLISTRFLHQFNIITIIQDPKLFNRLLSAEVCTDDKRILSPLLFIYLTNM